MCGIGPKTAPKTALWRRRLLWVSVGLVGVPLVAVLAAISLVWWYGREADAIDPSVLRSYQPPQVTRVLARDGTLIGELHAGERRTVVPYEALPAALIHAFLAAEDADFFAHRGLDWPSIARAAFSNLTHTGPRQGASTITQQVIKNTLLPRSRTFTRKSQELRLAGRVEAAVGKRRIFEIYVNEIYFGEGRYGVVEAARDCFGKRLDELDLGEMATLAALPNAPGIVTCRRRVERLRARRDYVLEQMVEHGFASRAEVLPYLASPIVTREREPSSTAIGEADEFVELARLELIRRYGEDALPRLGATVRTSVDLEIQRAARAAGRRELDELEARHGYGSHARPLSERARERLEARAPERLELGERVYAIVDRVLDDRLLATLGHHRIEVELGELADHSAAELARRFAPGHAIAVRISAAPNGTAPAKASLEPGPELALALAEVRSGELLALIGSREFRRGDFDRARLARRQPASSFKPIVHGAALRSGEFTISSTLAGDEGRPISLRDALAQSDNAIPLALMQALGPEPVHAFARELGLTAPLGEQPSLALGTSELTPLELLTAYLTLARGGEGIDPIAILEVEVPPDLRGDTPEPIAGEPSRRSFGIEAEIAAALTSMLSRVITEGTGKAAQALGRPIAGKTGTSDEARDLWFVGYTLEHAAVTWIGFDRPASLGRNESGSSLAVSIWLAAMERASEGRAVRDFVLESQTGASGFP
ncbi:MAG: transglycosylase domain-containing protein [Enhygromyxa sp.]